MVHFSVVYADEEIYKTVNHTLRSGVSNCIMLEYMTEARKLSAFLDHLELNMEDIISLTMH